MVFLIALSLAIVPPINGDILLKDVGVAVTETFDSFGGDGLSPTPTSTQLDSNTYRGTGFSEGDGFFGGTHDNGNFARGASNGGVDLSGAYAFDVGGGDIGVGIQATDTEFNPGTFTIRVANDTGKDINGVVLSGTAYFLNDQDRSSRWFFEISFDDINYSVFGFRDSREAKDVAPVWEDDPIFAFLDFPTQLADGERFYLRIRRTDLAGTGLRDEFALSNISFTAVPEPSSATYLAMFGLSLLGLKRRRQS